MSVTRSRTCSRAVAEVGPTRAIAPGPDEAGIPSGGRQPSSHLLDEPRPVHIDIVCQAAGRTTAAYSVGYVAGWSRGDPKVGTATAERVVTCAREILDGPELSWNRRRVPRR